MPTHKTSTLHLPAHYLDQVCTILRTHLPHAEVWAYGSRVRGDFFEASDLDLVVRQPKNLKEPQTNLDGLKAAFTESHLPIFVQVVDWARIPQAFHAEIQVEYVVVQKASQRALTT